jgi:ATP phosphoribosyltransferase
MPLRIAVPSPTSRLYGVAAEALNRLLGAPTAPHGRVLLESLADGSQLVYCRGTDVGVLVALGVADVGLTGYDMITEAAANGRPTPAIRSLAPARTSYVCVVKPERRTHVTRIYTEYPYLTRAWLSRAHMFGDAEVVTLHGAIEGVIALDDQSAGVILVTSGETAQANGLDMCLPLMATEYAAFLPMIAIAYGYVWRLVRTIDPRARLVIGLLHSVHMASRDARWRHDARVRDQVAMQIERTARVAERDLPHLLVYRTQDPGTSSWMRERSQLIGARIRECKRSLLLPDREALDTIRSELLRLLLHATSSEWDAMCAQQSPPSRFRGLLRKYAPHVITGALLVVAGLALPEFFPVLKGPAGSNLRTFLILSGFVALVPLDSGGLNRIPDAFAGAVNAKL